MGTHGTEKFQHGKPHCFKTKQKPKEWEKIFTNSTPDIWPVYIIYKELNMLKKKYSG